MQRIIIISLLAMAPCVSASATTQWYLGASVGSVEARAAEGAQSATALSALGFRDVQTGVDRRDTGFRLHAGYKFLPWLAVELGHADLGKHQIDSTLTVGAALSGSLSNNITVDGFDISLVGDVPLGRKFTAFGRVGAFTYESKSAVMSTGSVALFSGDSARREKRGTQAVYGLGLMYPLTPEVSLRGEWSRVAGLRRFDVIGTERKGDVDLYSLGVSYRFF